MANNRKVTLLKINKKTAFATVSISLLFGSVVVSPILPVLPVFAATSTTETVQANGVEGTAINDIQANHDGLDTSNELTNTISFTSGTTALPTGLTFNADNGTVTGTPTQTGTFSFTIHVADTSGNQIDTPVTLTIAAATLTPSTPSTTSSKVVYRIYNPNTGEHFYTESLGERNADIRNGWSDEGIGWSAPTSGTPVYRVFNPNVHGGDHYYTTSIGEANSLISKGWRPDNGGKPVFYSGGSVNVYVAYNPNAKSGSHNYTSNSAEQNALMTKGWKYGAVAFKGV